MSGLESSLVRVGMAVVVPAVRRWVGDRRRRADAGRPLSELLGRRFPDRFDRRRVEREIEAMADVVGQRIAPLVRSMGVPENELRAALDAAAESFTVAASEDESLFVADADPTKLAALVRARAADVPSRAGLGEAGERLYRLVLEECCVIYVRTVVHLDAFAPRATAEVLARLSGQGEMLAEVLTRLPVRTMEAPAGDEQDEQFRHRYLTYISTALDHVELFGVDVRRYRPRTTLSVAYVSLVVSVDDAPDGPRRLAGGRGEWIPGALRHSGLGAATAAESASIRVEQAFSRHRRTLLRGEAGSGKTTVLLWLAVTAARSAFSGELAGWNGYVPFLVRLRRFADAPLPSPQELVAATAGPVADLAPAAWAHRQLVSGRAMLFVDGVDELPAASRRSVRDWLGGILAMYPDIAVVVSTRPAAAAARWLSVDGFTAVMLERMSPADARALIGHWHQAVSNAPDLPCATGELPRYESVVVSRLDASPHLHALAASPLLCAMLCALNLDRRSHLPGDRMGLYAAAVELLLERRDVERDVVSGDVSIALRDKIEVMQYLAWRMTINNEVETTRDQTLTRIGERLAAMPQVTAQPTELLDHLLHRSGLIRQPVPDRISFVHRSFQEYLTAREVADRADVGMLVERAHRDMWRDVVTMVAGHANAPVREELLDRILDRADAEPAARRRLRLVAASCMETVPVVQPAVHARLVEAVGALVPPRNANEARSLSGVGEPLLVHLPATTSGLSEAAAAGSVRVAALVNGPHALGLLTRYAADGRPHVQRELARVWEYFDPDEYAQRVLATAALDNGLLSVSNPLMLPAIRHLKNLERLLVWPTETLDLATLDDVPHLWSLHLNRGATSRLDRLSAHPELRRLYVSRQNPDDDPTDLARLTQLQRLYSFGHNRISELRFLHRFEHLEGLGLGDLTDVQDYTPINGIEGLTELSLIRCRLRDFTVLAAMADLKNLFLNFSDRPDRGLPGIVDLSPHLEILSLFGCEWIDDVTALASLPRLERLMLGQTAVSNLEPLAGCTHLRKLDLSGCPRVVDLSPLADISTLVELDISGAAAGLDLTAVAGSRRLTVSLSPGQEVQGVTSRGSNIHLVRKPAS